MTGQDEVEEEQAFTLFDDAPVKDDTDWAVVLLGQAEEFPLYIEPQRVWIWDASRILLDWCLGNPDSLRAKQVHELGCGLGLPALAASLHATSVVASDFSPQAIDALVELIEFNQSRQPPPASSTGFGKIRGEVLDWTHVLAAERAGTLSVPHSARVDVVLGADVIYSVEHGLPLAATVDAYLRDGGHLVLTAKNIRLGLSVFFDEIQRRGFKYVDKQSHIGHTDGCEYTLHCLAKPTTPA